MSPVADGTYEVQPGDTLSRIAAKLGLDWHDLAAWNGIAAPYTIHPGDVLQTTAPAPAPDPLTSIREALAALSQRQTDDEARVTALTERVAALEQPTPPPAPARPAWGVNIGTDKGQLAAVDKTWGGIDAARFYWSPGQRIRYPSAKDLGGDLGNRILVLSSKVKPQDIAAGKADADITATAEACPTDRPTLLAMWHEPWDDVYKHKTFTAQQFRDGQARYAQLVHAAGNPNVMVALILMGETWNGGTKARPRDWREFYPGPDAVDVFCTDEYAWGPNSPKDIGTMFAKGRAAADGEGKPFCVTETGVEATTFTGQARIDAIGELAARVKAVTTGPVAMYFGADPGDRWDLVSDAKALAAWKAGRV